MASWTELAAGVEHKEVQSIPEATDWIQRNKGRLIRRAEKFQPYSTYDIDDFLQEAYTAAYTALETCKIKEGLKFEAAFWTIYTANLCSMATIPSQREVLGADASLAPCIHEEYLEEYSDDDRPPTPVFAIGTDPLTILVRAEEYQANKATEDRHSSALIQALMSMSEKQRQVWQCLLERRRPTTEQVAKRLNKTRQGVEQLRDYGLQRVKEAFTGSEAIPEALNEADEMYEGASMQPNEDYTPDQNIDYCAIKMAIITPILEESA